MKLSERIKGLPKRLVTWFCSVNWRQVCRQIIDGIGNVMHKMLFSWLLPKRHRNITKREIFEIIFKSDTPAGKTFDVWLLIAIIANILVLVTDSLFGTTSTITSSAHWTLSFWIIKILEWGFTLLFTFEYYLRIYCLKHPVKYVTSFWGIIDFLSIFPAYLSLFWPTGQALTVLRLLRTMRIFRIFRLEKFQEASTQLLNALKNSALRISVFMLFVFVAAVIMGTMMYSIEGEVNPAFNNVLSGIYWAVVTITTVGFGDVVPITPAGRFIAVLVMLLGYSIIAVPMGVVAGETINEHRKKKKKHHALKVVEDMEKDFDDEDEAIRN
ncbi:MAG: ion transporter [Bacteroidales bacterium]|nr:ion transporter [Bacteroidales bacterium]